MIHRIYNHFSVFSYDSNYEDFVDKIKTSRCYTAYINHNKNKGVSNFSYEKYLKIKQFLYINNTPPGKKNYVNAFTLGALSNDEKKIARSNKDFEVDDYCIIKRKLIENTDTSPLIKEITLTESIILNRSKELDNFLSNWEKKYLKEDFITNKKQRFFLLPFLCKVNDQVAEPMVILTVYNVGILTFNKF